MNWRRICPAYDHESAETARDGHVLDHGRVRDRAAARPAIGGRLTGGNHLKDQFTGIADQMAAGISAADMQRREGIRRVDMTPAVENGTVSSRVDQGYLHAINATTGKLEP